MDIHDLARLNRLFIDQMVPAYHTNLLSIASRITYRWKLLTHHYLWTNHKDNGFLIRLESIRYKKFFINGLYKEVL